LVTRGAAGVPYDQVQALLTALYLLDLILSRNLISNSIL